ncbi:drug/metabolite transporter, DME family [Saccharopolyspora antimicrobica]|uniref:DME family drug/metabolite transporter n=1 Tax=Saccharopolyspora antimicrobica TaxID=455193 RepID=A0A1I4X4A9_9PSEU|nr:EamA family transporter [Saccharopolyspora antimicrobica]RKT84317.1 DME family drug/metabolite transporter [Saccharopolyspora antimicrobica]SFN20878.1 drug/metabolite transporter, DME family [Saccharopolyspora antimicrobica]
MSNQLLDAPARASFRSGPLLVLLASALWGTTGTAASFAPAGASPLSIGAATMGVGGLLLLAIAGRSAFEVLRSGQLRLLVVGALAVAVYPLAFYSSMALAGVAIGTVVTLGSAPVFAAILERVVDGVRLDGRWAVSAALAVLGLLLITGGGWAGADANTLLGALLGLLGGAGYVVYSWSASRLMRRGHGSRAVMGAMFGAGALILLPVLALTGGPLLSSSSGLAVAGYLAVIPMGLAYVLFGAGLRHTSTSAATTLSLLEPVVAAILGVLVVGERLDVGAWCGTVLIGAGLVLVSTRR